MSTNNDWDIAIVGMAGRFPGAPTLDQFWQNLAAGVESIARFSDRDILAAGVPATLLENPAYVKAAPVLDEPGAFDAGFFGFAPMEARTMDPQHRILLELAHEALENAGYAPSPARGAARVGVFTGCALNTYVTNVGLHRRLGEDYIPTLIGNDKDFLSTRISYKLNLKGPSLTVQTACSTSLVALHLACQSLRSEESDMALAGAVSVRVPHRAGYLADAGGVVSPDGHVRAFDARANGTVFGSGGGIVVLKRLADALAAGDTIRAVIKGSAVNNDGSAKAGYTAPSVDSQADAVVEALANAGVEADSIGYIEAHGSGTPVGDPIEVRALTKAFRTFTPRAGFCALGSVKTNVGHLDAAAGIAGVIKTVLALEHRQLPASLHYSEANPEIDFPGTPFYVNTELRSWTSDGPRRAGVMATGMGGTNAHVVLEEAPVLAEATDSQRPQLLVWSAKTEAALDRATEQLRAHLGTDQSASLSDVAHTLQVGRAAFAHRRFLVSAGREAPDFTRAVSGRIAAGRRPVILLLPGVGDHYVGMGHDLYQAWPTFRDEVDRCAALFQPMLGRDLRDLLYPKTGTWKQRPASKGIDLKKMLGRGGAAAPDPDSETLNQTLYAQPALFTIEYATACLWQSLGITPDAIVGHSMGEYVAACLAGVMSLEDATRLVATRARLANELPQGAMLAVTLAEDELRPLLSAELSISLINGPKLCVVAGPAAAVAQFEAQLTERKIISRRVANAHAFHSRMIEPIVPALEQEFAKVRLNPPAIPYVSNVTGTWITPAQATDPAYWATHATRTARFSDALRELWRLPEKDAILLEAGPGRTLGVLAMQHPDRQSGGDPVVLSSLRHVYENQSDVEFFLNAVGRVWTSGVDVKWDALPSSGPRRRVPLPTYPFERRVHWLESPLGHAETPPPAAPAGVDDWFYVPTWERTPFPTEPPDREPVWLVIGDRAGAGRVKKELDTRGLACVLASFGDELLEGGLEDYVRLFRALAPRAQRGLNIVHLGSVTRGASKQEFGFYSLLHIAQALGELNLSVPVKLGVVSNRLHEVTGDEHLDPEKATVLGPCGVIPREYPNITCFNVDLPDSDEIEQLPDTRLTALLSEFADAQSGAVVAYRGRHRWKRGYQKIALPPPGTVPPRLKTGGVYLITGGTGGLGLAVSKYLAAACRPTLVLTKQSPLRAGRTIQALALKEIEALGARVEVMVADASDREQMQAVVAGVLKKYGAIDGVIHAAGIVRAGVIQAKTREMAARVMAPKVDGTRILYDLLRAAKPDFLVLFSSITTVSTPYAEVDYVAANAFLDAFSHFANVEGQCRTLTINWPGWKEVGQLADLETLPGVESWKEAALERAIATADGVEAFKRALSSGLPQVIVSPQGIDQVLAEAAAPFDPAAYLRPRRTQGAAPQGDALQQIWCDVLGLEQVGEGERFADLGGHSLLAMQIVAQIRSSYQIDFTLRDFFDAPTIAESRALIEGRVAAPAPLSQPPIPRRAERDVAPLSSIQRQMWVIDQMTPGNPAYNLPAAYRLHGDLDVGTLERSFNEIIRRHEALRTTFVSQDGEPQQQVHPELTIRVRVVALDHLQGEEQEERLQALASEAAVTPFDLSRLPLIRVTLFRLSEVEHVLLINVHHIVTDGLSFGVLLNELDALYRGARPAELAVQYGDFAHWQRQTQAESAHPGEIDFWRTQLGGTLAPLELPTDRPRPAAQSFAGSNVWFTIPPALAQQLTELGGRAGCTAFMTMLAAFQVLLERHAGVDDLIIGTPIADRTRRELEPLIGNFLNMVALRGDLAGDPTFVEVLRRSHDTTVNALTNARVPFETVMRHVKFERDSSRNPIFQVMLQMLGAPAPRIGHLEVSSFHFDPRIAQFDLSLHLYEEGGGYQGRFEYCTDLFERETVERLTARFEQLLRAVVENPEQRISALALLPSAERCVLVHEWNDTAAEVPAGKLTHELFEAQVARAPARTALRAGETSLSYAELDARANRVAHALRSRGVGRGDRVGLCLDRGSDMLAALLGILKSGAAYVPLDPAFPAQRLRFMADDAKLALLLDSGADFIATGSGHRAPVADGASGEDPAYVIYTSGSTGTPKGVAVPHRAVVNFLTSMAREPGLAADDVLVAVTTLSFDIAVLELLLPLTVGATVVLASRDEAMDGRALRTLLEKHRATVMQATPVTWRLLLEAGWTPVAPFRALVGGEALPQDLAQQLIDCGAELWNMYGPTETTVWSTCARISDASRITIGKPIANTTVRVLDARGELSPIGVPGELCIGGDGVALGYWNRPDLTAERFIADSFGENRARLYRTGDRVRWRADGTLEHLGRFDDQVKVRGFRIELGEIEAAIAACPGVGVREVAVAAREDRPGEKRLVAYVVATNSLQAPDVAEAIRARIRTVLPEYMVPSRFVTLHALPRTQNGKIDRKALPAPGEGPAEPRDAAVAPRTATEAMVLGVLREVLGRGDFGADGNFFDLGGDSLMAARMVLRLRALSGVDVPLRALFERQTVAGMAEAIDALQWLAASERPVSVASTAGRERVEIEL